MKTWRSLISMRAFVVGALVALSIFFGHPANANCSTKRMVRLTPYEARQLLAASGISADRLKELLTSGKAITINLPKNSITKGCGCPVAPEEPP